MLNKYLNGVQYNIVCSPTASCVGMYSYINRNTNVLVFNTIPDMKFSSL